MQLDRTERRILGSLIEKRWATPDQYPLSLNALVAACNQKSNRDPVLQLEEFEISGCLLGLREKGLVLIRERDGGRVKRYAEKLTEELTLEPLTAAVLAELMLRGPQTASELSRRVNRMVPVDGVGPVEECLADLARSRLVMLMARQAGQKYARWSHLWREDAGDAGENGEGAEETDGHPSDVVVRPPPGIAPEPAVVAPPPVTAQPEPPADPAPDLRAEVERLQREVAELRERLERLESVVL